MLVVGMGLLLLLIGYFLGVAFLGSAVGGLVIALVVWALVFIRAQRKSAGKSPLLDDEAFQGLLNMVENLSQQFEEQKGATKKRTTRKKTRRVAAS